MKILGKLLIVLAVTALVLVPVAGCQGPQTRQIVVTWDIEEFPGYSSFTVADVYVTQLVRIKGAGFDRGDKVILTICEKDVVLDLWELDYDKWQLIDI